MAGGELFAVLAPAEVLLQGTLANDVTGPPDVVELRIQWLVANCLEAFGRAANGWDWLFHDPRDGRWWEQTFPLGSLHGSGPRRLAVIDRTEALAKYPHSR
jgi:hypothetical protein